MADFPENGCGHRVVQVPLNPQKGNHNVGKWVVTGWYKIPIESPILGNHFSSGENHVPLVADVV